MRALLGMSPKTLRIAAERGEIEATHPLAEGPWLFKRAILEREETKCLVARVHRRRLHSTGPKYQQSNLFESKVQRGSYASIAAQGRADPACHPDCRSHARDASSGRTALPIFQSVSFRQGQDHLGQALLLHRPDPALRIGIQVRA